MLKSKKSTNLKYNCFQYGIAFICDFFQTDYEMIFLSQWGFSYKYDLYNSIGENLSEYWIKYADRQQNILEKFHGITYNKIKLDFELIKAILKVKPIMVYIDSFFCDWLPFYYKEHIYHAIIIYAVEKNDFLICDQYVNKDFHKKISFEFLVKYSNDVLVFSYNKSNIKPLYYIDEIINTAKFYSKFKSENNINLFILDVKNRLVLSNEIDRRDPSSSLLLRELKYISDDRYNLVESLQYIEKKVNMNCSTIISNLCSVSKLYDELRFYLMKNAFVKGEINKEHVLQILYLIKDLEKMVNCNLLDINKKD